MDRSRHEAAFTSTMSRAYRWLGLLALALLLFLTGGQPTGLIPTVQAHDFGGGSDPEPPDPPDPDDPCKEECCNDGSSGDPVFLLDGGERPRFTDLVVNGLYPIRITRHYDSQSTYDTPWAMAGHSGTTGACSSTRTAPWSSAAAAAIATCSNSPAAPTSPPTTACAAS